MKSKCDNHCETCPIQGQIQGQIYCALQYIKSLNDRVTNIEKNIFSDAIVIDPIQRDTHNIENGEEQIKESEDSDRNQRGKDYQRGKE